MAEISSKIGECIRRYRRLRKMSLDDMASAINKGRSTVAKYETGDISIDMDTLFEISKALKVPMEAFFESIEDEEGENELLKDIPPFFDRKNLYVYYWDGRNNTLNSSLLKISSRNEDSSFNASLYMNVKDWKYPYICENTYNGKIRFYNVLTNIVMVHQDTPLEHIMMNIPESFGSTQTRMALFSGVSFRPFMPCAVKMLISRNPLEQDDPILKKLFISKDDIRKLKIYNFFTVTQEW